MLGIPKVVLFTNLWFKWLVNTVIGQTVFVILLSFEDSYLYFSSQILKVWEIPDMCYFNFIVEQLAVGSVEGSK